MNIFRIPKISDKGCDKIIGIIDASGSMKEHWHWLADHWNRYIPSEKTITITFDHVARIVPNNHLSNFISHHGGGGTNISNAFEEFENELNKIEPKSNITVIFISDGHDSKMNSLKQRLSKLKGNQDKFIINFLCLGVGKNFPTFISMKLRESYHNGNESVPAVFLIEYVSEKAYTIKFNAIMKFMVFNQQRCIEPAVCVYPWREYQKIVFENAWVMSFNNTVKIDGKELDISKYNLNLDGVLELFRGWSQSIHIESLNKGEAIYGRAAKTLGIMDDILAEIFYKEGIDLLDINPITEDMSFKDKAKQTMLRNNYNRIKWFYDDVKLIVDGKISNNMNEFDAAKKIGIGTIMGNYKQKLLNLKSITLEKFKHKKELFKDIYKATEIKQYTENQLNWIGKKNQKNIFLEETFLEGLELCQNQFDLFNSLSLIGIPIKLKRPLYYLTMDLSKIEVKNIGKLGEIVDSTMINLNNGNLEAKGIDSKSDLFNAVLPVFLKTDKDILPIINSELFQLLMSFNVSRNPDTIYKEAYLDLLGKAILFLLQNDDTSSKDMLKLLINQFRLIISENSTFVQQSDMFLLKPFDFIVSTELPLERIVLMVIYAKFLSKKKYSYFEEAIQAIYLKLYQIAHKTDYQLLYKFLKLKETEIKEVTFKSGKKKRKLSEQQKETFKEIINSTRYDFNNYYSMGDFKRGFLNHYRSYFTTQQIEAVWDIKNGLQQLKGTVNPLLMEKLENWIGCKNRTEEDHQTFISLAKFSDISNIIKKYKQEIPNYSCYYIKKAFMRYKKEASLTTDKQEKLMSSPMYQNILKRLRKEFINYFKEKHKFIIPLTNKEADIARKRNPRLNINNQNMATNACMAKGCRFYLQVRNRLSHHLDIWGFKLPRSFHRIVLRYLDKDPYHIYGMVCEQIPGFTPEKFHSDYDTVIQYIQKIKENNEKNKST